MGHREYASTVVERSAVQGVRRGMQYVSTVVYALDARSAVVHKSASTVVGALSVRSAVGHKSASTVVSALSARSVKAHACDTTSATQQTAMMEAFRWREERIDSTQDCDV